MTANMPRPIRSRLFPWIENLIMSYGTEEERSSERLKAHVIGVGEMTQSQAQNSDSPVGLLFLSDGMLQIPAFLTTSAWEHLQDQEDRDSFSSLINTTVVIQDYRLQFHMAQEQNKCRFFLAIGELATTAAGPVINNAPCCTTLSSVRMKIRKTWKTLLDQEVWDSQATPCGTDLSELLGEWQHDCIRAVLEDIEVRLKALQSHPVSLKPSTSTCTSMAADEDAYSTTSWDVDRVRYKAVKSFSIPIKSLLIPDEALQQQTSADVGSKMPEGFSASSVDKKKELPQVCSLSAVAHTSDNNAEGINSKPNIKTMELDATESFPVSAEDMNVGMIDSSIRPLSNPWDIFTPPCDTSSSSDLSPEATPTHVMDSNAAFESNANQTAILTSTQLQSLQTSEQSYLAPYQKPLQSNLHTTAGFLTSMIVSPPELYIKSAKEFPPTDEPNSDTAQQKHRVLEQQNSGTDIEETAEKKYGKRKRTTETQTILVDEEEEDTQISRSPPSWLFDSQVGFRFQEDSSNYMAKSVEAILRKTRSVHSDGSPFSYSYQVSGQSLQDFSQFKVSGSWLHWAVKYLLVSEKTNNPHSTSATSSQSSCDRTGNIFPSCSEC